MEKLSIDDLFEAFKFTDSDTYAFIDGERKIHYEKAGEIETELVDNKIYLPSKEEFSEHHFLIQFSYVLDDLALKTILSNMIEKREKYIDILKFMKENGLDELWEEFYEKEAKKILEKWAKENKLKIEES